MAASLVGAGKARQAHFKNGPPSSKRRGIESRLRFTFPSPTWPRGQEGGSRQAPPTPRAEPIAAGSSARAGALPPTSGGPAAAIFWAPVAMAPPPRRRRVRCGPTRGGQSRSLRLLSLRWAGALGGWFAGRRLSRGRAPRGERRTRGSEAEGTDQPPALRSPPGTSARTPGHPRSTRLQTCQPPAPGACGPPTTGSSIKSSSCCLRN